MVTATATAQILLVEDDPSDAFLAEELLLAHAGEFSLTWVRNLAEGLAAIGPATDCVLLDLGLPDTTGLEGLRAILEADARPAVVVLTGFDDRASGEEALALGAQDYLAKGAVSDDALVRAVRYAIARRRVEESSRRLRDAELLQAENSRLERGLLPRPLILNAGLAWATRYEPGGRRALLGGDFFDAVETDDGTIRVVIGDVCGHGPDEAALGVALRVAWRALVLADRPPEATLVALERVLEVERASEEVFATLCDIEIDSSLERAKLRLGGHPGPLLYDGTTVSEVPISPRHPLLGWDRVDGWEPSLVELGAEWTLVAFTDGIVEGRSGVGDARLDTSGLIELATRAFAETTTLNAVAERLLSGAEQANGGPLSDDVALVILSTARRWRT